MYHVWYEFLKHIADFSSKEIFGYLLIMGFKKTEARKNRNKLLDTDAKKFYNKLLTCIPFGIESHNTTIIPLWTRSQYYAAL